MRWNRDVVGNLVRNTADTSERAHDAQCRLDRDPMNAELRTQAVELRKIVAKAIDDEESLARQKSRAIWLKEGDINTKFFYATLKTRQARNHIRVLDIDET